MDNIKTLLTLRHMYYIGLLLLIINALPMARDYLAGVFDYIPFGKMSIITLVALGTTLGAIQAFRRKM
jgi:hypothetical protein